MTVPFQLDLVQSRSQGTIALLSPSGNKQLLQEESWEGLLELGRKGLLLLEGKRVVVDPFSKTTVEFHVEEGVLSSFFRRASRRFPLKDCDFLCLKGQPWYMQGTFIYQFSEEIPLDWVKKEGIVLTEQELEDLKEDCEEEEIPLEILSEGTKSSGVDTQPILCLRDSRGVLAGMRVSYQEFGEVDLLDPCPHVGKERIRRNRERERAWEEDLLASGYEKTVTEDAQYYCPADRVREALELLLDFGWKVMDREERELLHGGQAHLEALEREGGVELKGSFAYGSHQLPVAQVLGAMDRGQAFVSIGTHSIALLPPKEQLDSLSALGEVREWVQERLRLPKSRTLGVLEDLSSIQGVNLSSGLSQIKEKMKGFRPVDKVEPGGGFHGTLRSYQQEGLNWMVFLHQLGLNGLLADEMGLGKTVQVLAFLSCLNLQLKEPVLIVVPRSLLFNWQREIEQFLPGTPVLIHHGAERGDSLDHLVQPGVLLTSYHTLRRDLELFRQIPFQVVILDEAQIIKNPETQLARAVCQIQGQMKLSLTGTPVENRAEELWSQFHFLQSDLLGSRQDFVSQMMTAQEDPLILRRLQRRIRPFLLRRTKDEVARDLPEKTEQVLWVRMGQKQKDYYKQFLSDFKHRLLQKVGVDGLGKCQMEVFEAILRLRQICCAPELQGEPVESAKIELLVEELDTLVAEGKKVLVYSQFVKVLALIAKELKKKDWPFLMLHGQTENREKVVREFQEGDSPKIFLLSLKAGGYGLNLTAADVVYLFDPWWNEAVEAQAIDRAHRIGRKDPIVAKRLICVDSIEEKMMSLKDQKRQLTEALWEGTVTGKSFDLEDLEYLLS